MQPNEIWFNLIFWICIMEISATTTSTHSQATSSSGSIAATGTSNTVIVQSPSDEGIVLSSLSDIQQLHHQSSNVSLTSSHSKHLLHQHHALIQTPQSSTTLSASVRSSSIQQASSSSTSSPLLSPPGKTIGRNNNGTSEYKFYLFRLIQTESIVNCTSVRNHLTWRQNNSFNQKSEVNQFFFLLSTVDVREIVGVIKTVFFSVRFSSQPLQPSFENFIFPFRFRSVHFTDKQICL